MYNTSKKNLKTATYIFDCNKIMTEMYKRFN